MPDETPDSETPGAPGAPDDAPTEPADLRLVALRRADRWVLGEAARPEPGRPFEVRLADGTRQTFARPPITLAWVQVGSLLHEAAQDPAAVQRRFLTEPGEVVAQLLRDLGRPQVKADLVQRVSDLHLRAPGDWWPTVSKALKAHPHVRVEGGKYTWSDTPVNASGSMRGAAGPVRRPAVPGGDASTAARRPAPGAPSVPAAGPSAPAPVARPEPTPAAARQAAEASRHTQARLTVLRVLRQLAQSPGDDERLRRELEGAAAELPEGAPEGALAALLVTALLDPRAFDAAPLLSRGLESSARYDVARVAVRLRAYGAAVRSLFGLERLDTERLLTQLPWDDPALARALGDHLASLPGLDARTAQRVEGALRQLALAADTADDPEPVRVTALALLAALGRLPGTAAHPGLLLLGRAALRACLRAGLGPDAVRDLDTPAVVRLVTGPFAAPDGLPVPAFAALLRALDAADRGDALDDPGLWAGVDVVAVASDTGVAEIVTRRGLGGTLAPLLQDREDAADGQDVVRLLTLPDAVLAALPPATLSERLAALAAGDTALGAALRDLVAADANAKADTDTEAVPARQAG